MKWRGGQRSWLFDSQGIKAKERRYADDGQLLRFYEGVKSQSQ